MHSLSPDVPPMDLPRLVMRRAVWVALAAWLLVLVLGLQRVSHDMQQEVAAADTVARLSALLARASHEPDDARLLADIRRLLDAAPLRHLALSVRDADGAVLLDASKVTAPSAPLSWLLALHRAWLPARDSAPVGWALARGAQREWRVELTVSHESERAEAIENLSELLLLAAGGSVALLLAMAWNVRHAFAPMRALLQAIGRLRGGEAGAVQHLPAMPIAELHAIGSALAELGSALEAAEQQRRALSRKVLTLQEDERQRIARELHDEFGQRLTALRADAAWLTQRVAGDAQALPVVASMAQQCARLQAEIRALLERLQPAGHADPAEEASLLKLQCMLEDLVRAWNTTAGAGVRFQLELATTGPDGAAARWPDASEADAVVLPQALLLALYRISQEALTNVARHANASAASLRLSLARHTDGVVLHWQVSDDGAGLGSLQVALQRGNGLAGMRQRVWAFGGDLACEAALDGTHARRGLRLSARFVVPGSTLAGAGQAALVAG